MSDQSMNENLLSQAAIPLLDRDARLEEVQERGEAVAFQGQRGEIFICRPEDTVAFRKNRTGMAPVRFHFGFRFVRSESPRFRATRMSG